MVGCESDNVVTGVGVDSNKWWGCESDNVVTGVGVDSNKWRGVSLIML